MKHFPHKSFFHQTIGYISAAAILLLIVAAVPVFNAFDFSYHLNRYPLNSIQQIQQTRSAQNLVSDGTLLYTDHFSEFITEQSLYWQASPPGTYPYAQLQNALLPGKLPQRTLMFSLYSKLLLSSILIIFILAVHHRRHEVKMQAVETSLRTINQSLKLALEHASINLYIYDFASGSMTLHSLYDEQGCPRILKKGPLTMVEMGAVAPQHIEEFLSLFQQLRSADCVVEKNLLLRLPSCPSYFWNHITLTCVSQPGQPPTQAIVTFEDISEELRRENNLRLRSYQDALTGLLNRSGLRHEMAELAENNSFLGLAAFLLIDLDHFKEVNDTMGHPTGDILLQKAASLLLNLTPENSRCVRFGGDEFVILLRDSSWKEAEGLAQRICSEIPLLSHSLSLSVSVGASVGLHLFDPKAETLQQVYQKADIALYSAKKDRSCWVSTRHFSKS